MGFCGCRFVRDFFVGGMLMNINSLKGEKLKVWIFYSRNFVINNLVLVLGRRMDLFFVFRFLYNIELLIRGFLFLDRVFFR